MRFNVPVGMLILGIVLLVARDLDLLPTPLWQDGIGSPHVAVEVLMPESDTTGQGSDDLSWLGLAEVHVIDDFNNPIVV